MREGLLLEHVTDVKIILQIIKIVEKNKKKREGKRKKKRERDLIIMTMYEADMITMMVVEGQGDRKTETEKHYKYFFCSGNLYMFFMTLQGCEMNQES